MLDASLIARRCFCRNPHCRSRLPQTVADLWDAFCDQACRDRYLQFNCLVCDRPLRQHGRRQRRFCTHKCQQVYHRNPERFSRREGVAATTLPDARRSAPKSPTKSTAISPDFSDLPLRVVAGPADSLHPLNLVVPPDAETALRLGRANARFWNAATLLKRRSWPIDLVGGAGGPRQNWLEPELRRRIIETEIPQKVGANKWI